MDKMVEQYRKQYHIILDSRPGPTTDKADARIEKMVEKAEAEGVLDTFLRRCTEEVHSA